jgi:hypothetical protein
VHRLRQIWVIKVTDSDIFNIYHLAHSCLHLADLGCNSPTVANESFYWKNTDMFIPVSFKKRFFQQNRRNESHANTVHFHSSHIQTAWALWSLNNSFSHLRALFLSPVPFACRLQCTTHPMSVTREKNFPSQIFISLPLTTTHSLHRCQHNSVS